ncbi:hypothetical protein ACFQH2_11775 [Natronoarchaeum sp. GCM10025703]|uniref:hypothetical protein n=1 Tax=Natronoarchaeum sp. GCM10025703 TaxID=3252685 RepID=UPI003615CD1F
MIVLIVPSDRAEFVGIAASDPILSFEGLLARDQLITLDSSCRRGRRRAGRVLTDGDGQVVTGGAVGLVRYRSLDGAFAGGRELTDERVCSSVEFRVSLDDGPIDAPLDAVYWRRSRFDSSGVGYLVVDERIQNCQRPSPPVQVTGQRRRTSHRYQFDHVRP